MRFFFFLIAVLTGSCYTYIYSGVALTMSGSGHQCQASPISETFRGTIIAEAGLNMLTTSDPRY